MNEPYFELGNLPEIDQEFGDMHLIGPPWA